MKLRQPLQEKKLWLTIKINSSYDFKLQTYLAKPYYELIFRTYDDLYEPLTDLLKKGQFTWNAEATMAFDYLKMATSNTHVLGLPDLQIQ